MPSVGTEARRRSRGGDTTSLPPREASAMTPAPMSSSAYAAAAVAAAALPSPDPDPVKSELPAPRAASAAAKMLSPRSPLLLPPLPPLLLLWPRALCERACGGDGGVARIPAAPGDGEKSDGAGGASSRCGVAAARMSRLPRGCTSTELARLGVGGVVEEREEAV